MIVRSDAGTIYLFTEDKRYWVLLNQPAKEYNDYLIPYNNYKYFLTPTVLTKWRDE